MSNLKVSIKSDDLIVVQFVEKITGYSEPSLFHFPKEMLEKIEQAQRTVFLSSMVAWGHLAQAVLDGAEISLMGEDKLLLTPPPNFPPLEKLTGYIVRSLQKMEKRWPEEAAFVHSCLPDLESALMMIYPSPVPGGMSTIGSLLHPNYPGVIARYPSPICFHWERN